MGGVRSKGEGLLVAIVNATSPLGRRAILSPSSRSFHCSLTKAVYIASPAAFKKQGLLCFYGDRRQHNTHRAHRCFVQGKDELLWCTEAQHTWHSLIVGSHAAFMGKSSWVACVI